MIINCKRAPHNLLNFANLIAQIFDIDIILQIACLECMIHIVDMAIDSSATLFILLQRKAITTLAIK